MTPTLLEIFLTFLRASAMGFGGGAALAPAIYRECVQKKTWISETKFGDILAVSNILPGPSAVEMATAIGWEVRGLPGGLAAVAGLTVPFAAVMIVMMLTVFDRLHTHPEEKVWFNRATMGLFVFVAVMSLQLSVKLFRDLTQEVSRYTAAGVCAAVFFLVDDNLWAGHQLPFRINNSFVILVMIAVVVLNEAAWTRKVKGLCLIPSFLFLWSLSALYPESFPHYGWLAGISFGLIVGISGLAFRAVPAAKMEHAHPLISLELWRKIAMGQVKLMGGVLAFWMFLALVFAPLRVMVFVKLVSVTIFTSLLTFGGGPVYIPLAISAMAGEDASLFLYTKERMMEVIALQNVLPSPIMTKLSAASGYDLVNDLIYNLFPNNGIEPLASGTFCPGVAPWAGAAVLLLAMTVPAVTAMMFAWPSIDMIKASPSLRDTARWIKPILVAVFVSIGIMFLENSWDLLTQSVSDSGMGLTESRAGIHLFLLSGLCYLFLAKRWFSDFWVILLAIAWGLLLS